MIFWEGKDLAILHLQSCSDACLSKFYSVPLYLFLLIIPIGHSYKSGFGISDRELMMHALHSQALESIEKAQELAEGLGNKVGSYSFSSALSVT